MRKKSFFTICLLGAPVFSLSVFSQKTEKKPNIVLILADDMGYSDIGCFGSEIKTPNLDRLASQGVRFTQFYNASRSCPTRASLLTGLYQHQAGVGDMVNDLGYPSYQGYLNTQCVTLGEALKLNGYNTYMSGKWHVGGRDETLPRHRGFDRYFGLIDGAGSYFERISYRKNQPAPRWMIDDADFNPPDSGFYMTDAITDNALSFIKAGSVSRNPFFLYLAFTSPHWPLHALPEDIAKYRGKYMKGWDILRKERYQKMLQFGIIDPSAKLSPRDLDSPDWESLTAEEKKMWDLRMSVYAAMIDRMDQNIGRVIEQLKKSGELENTLVIFLSDNGGCHEDTRNMKNFLQTKGETGTRNSFEAIEIPWANVCNTPFRMFKHWVHEGGIATPFIAYYPKEIKGGTISRQPGHIIDLMPTFLEWAGGKYPEIFNGNKIHPMEGISLVPALKGKELKRENPFCWEHEGNRAIRSGDWKLVSAYDNTAKKFKSWELYDLKSDRSELNDLSTKDPDRTKEMIAQYNKWAERVGVISKEILDKKK
jgi:arylsulfatase A-like enzyme